MKCSRSPHYLMAIVALAIAVAGCAGKVAREKVLVPAILQTWPSIKADIQMGPNAIPATLGEFADAIESKDAATIAALVPTHWNSLRTTGEFNINAQSWSPGIKASALEKFKTFSEALERLASPAP